MDSSAVVGCQQPRHPMDPGVAHRHLHTTPPRPPAGFRHRVHKSAGYPDVIAPWHQSSWPHPLQIPVYRPARSRPARRTPWRSSTGLRWTESTTACPGTVSSARLHHAAVHEGRLLVPIGWQVSAFKVDVRDRWTGRSLDQQLSRLRPVASNARHVLPGWHRPCNPSSRMQAPGPAGMGSKTSSEPM